MGDLYSYLKNRERNVDKSKGNLIENTITVDHKSANGVLKCLNNAITITSSATVKSDFEIITSYTCSARYIAFITKAIFALRPSGQYSTDFKFMGNLPAEIFLRLERLDTSNGALMPISAISENNSPITYDFSSNPLRLFESDTIALLSRVWPYQLDGANNAGSISIYGTLWLYLLDKTSNAFQGERRFDFNNSLGLS